VALIELNGITRIYGEGETEVRALDGIDLSIERGEIIALLGPSGSGKTTLLNIIAALDEPTEGTYSFESQEVPNGNVEAMTTFRRENIGYIFQFFNLLGDLTALENVLLVQEIAGVRDKELAISQLKEVGLEGLEDRFPAQMSGGQRQRVAIARSLSKKPNIILGDELTGNLDSETSNQVMDSLIETCREGDLTTMFVTHDTSLTRFATRVINLDSGRVVSDEPGGLSTMAGQARSAAKDIAKGAKNIVESIKDVAKDIIG
jgi:putative ABC transport system ATP-binding protein|tara:strand:- start:41 stop:823 length:783 start_codon:yes stop_codon:yes gene_type:complete